MHIFKKIVLAVRGLAFFTVKNAIIIVVIVALGALIYVYKGLAVAALVNGKPVSRFALIRELEKGSGKQVLETLITEKLVKGALDKERIFVSEYEAQSEIKKLEENIVKQGGTLDQLLDTEGIKKSDLVKQLTLQLRVKKLFADKIKVGDEEVDAYIKENKVKVPKDKPEAFKEQIKNQLEGQKLNQAASEWVETLRSEASIRYFVNY